MGILHGNQKMVNAGLVVCLDAANINSYNIKRGGPAIDAQSLYTTPGTHTFEVPVGVTSISAVCVGGGGAGGPSASGEDGGGGGGGGLSYGTIAVTPLEDLTVIVGEGGATPSSTSDGTAGGDSQLKRSSTILLEGEGGGGGEYPADGEAAGEKGLGGGSSGTGRTGGGTGGNGGVGGGGGGGGGGAAGYSGDGGTGQNYPGAGAGEDGAGGGGGGAGSNGPSDNSTQDGGGVGVIGESDPVANGEGGDAYEDGFPGSDGSGKSYGGGGGGAYRHGGGAAYGAIGADGAVRIVYHPDDTSRVYPLKSNVQDAIYYGDSTKWNYLEFNRLGTGPGTWAPGNRFATLNGPTFDTNYFDFDGTDDYVELTGTTNFNYPITTNVTLSVFVKFDTVGALKGLITKNRSTSTQLGLWLNASSKLSFSANGSDLAGSTSLTTGTWYNLVGVQLSSISRKVYINGVLDGTKTSSFGTTPSGSENWMIGQATGVTEFLDGQIANATIYNKALTAAEVLQNYNAHKGRFGL